MIVACWSVKGGSGTTVVSAALGLALARQGVASLLVDTAGDLPAVLGLAEPNGPGLNDWLQLGPSAPVQALGRLEQPCVEGLSLLARGALSGREPDEQQWQRWTAAAEADPRRVVVDCGLITSGTRPVIATASRSVLVIRSCYLALRRAAQSPLRPSTVVLVRDTGRALGPDDVRDVLGVPNVVQVDVDPAVGRIIDAGLLMARVPPRLLRTLRALV